MLQSGLKAAQQQDVPIAEEFLIINTRSYPFWGTPIPGNPHITMTGWWFGTWLLLFHSVRNVIIPTDFHSIFQRGRSTMIFRMERRGERPLGARHGRRALPRAAGAAAAGGLEADGGLEGSTGEVVSPGTSPGPQLTRPVKRPQNYGKSQCLMGKLTISMAIFNSYVSLPEGTSVYHVVAMQYTWTLVKNR